MNILIISLLYFCLSLCQNVDACCDHGDCSQKSGGCCCDEKHYGSGECVDKSEHCATIFKPHCENFFFRKCIRCACPKTCGLCESSSSSSEESVEVTSTTTIPTTTTPVRVAEAIIGKIMESRAKAEEFLHPRVDIPDIKSQDSDPGKVETSTVNQESNQESTISTHPGEVTTVTPDLEQNPEVTTVIFGNTRSTQSGESTGRSTASRPVEIMTSLRTGVALETTTIGVLGEILRSPASDSSPANSVRNVTEGPTSTAQVSTTQAQVSSENATQSSIQSTSTMRADTTTTPTIAKTSPTSSNLELTTAEPKCRPCSREENATSAEKSFEPGSHQSGEWHRRPHPHGRWGGPPPGGFGGHWRHNGPGHWHEHFHNHTKHLPCCT